MEDEMRVLIADDSKVMRMILIRTLRQSGLHVDAVCEAADGAVALDAVATFAPTLILCDWNMPNMSGIEFLQKLRATGNTTTVGFVTSESNTEMKEQAIAAGASFFLRKPFDAERLGEIIGAVMA
jgi:two-component system, chemotaxis family, chemotaxis protein CheY